MAKDFLEDVEVISNLEIVPTILEVVCQTTGMGFATIARVTEDRWIACGVRDEIGFGLAAHGELQVETTLCKEVRNALEPIIISDASTDPIYCQHPTPSIYGFRSYISAPIILKNGEVFGTLCSLDRTPHDLSSPWLVGMFKLFAQLIAFHLDAHQELKINTANLATSRADLAASKSNLATSEAYLAASRADLAKSAASPVDERSNSELREQFIAVLGRDLRNPLASIDAGTRLLAKENLPDHAHNLLSMIGKSVQRMHDLIEDFLDFARGRLGGGIPVEKTGRVALAPMLTQVVSELQSGNPGREIITEFDGLSDCLCDPARIGQLLSNLLANALTHGATDTPVIVRGFVQNGILELSVANGGAPIPPEAMQGLFKPFVRAAARPSQ